MDPHLMFLFKVELNFQCAVILRADEDIRAALDRSERTMAETRLDNEKRGESQRDVWIGLQQALVASSIISWLLWDGGSGAGMAARKPLRDDLGASDKSPLRDRDLRDSWQHVDERLERWWSESPNHIFTGFSIGPDSMFGGPGWKPGNEFGRFDPAQSKVVFLGHTVILRDLVAEARGLRAKLQVDERLRWP